MVEGTGQSHAATGGAEPAAPYYNGRFSNGPIWLDHVAGFPGVPLKPYILGGTDYAFGGAWVTQPKSVTGVPSVPEQVGLLYVNALDVRLLSLSDIWAVRHLIMIFKSRDQLSASTAALVGFLGSKP